jgi:2-polyprenyl-3-methyl-5-hydroxy-6-metoxy-1,4-benzoquinol methylase
MNPVQCLCGGVASVLSQNGREVAVTAFDRRSCLHLCQSCGHVFFYPTTTDSELADYYNGPWNAGSTHRIEDSFEQWIEKLDGFAPQRSFVDAILRLREKYFGTNRRVVIHDASCGFGALVAKLNASGFDASGSDIDGESIRDARERGVLNLHQCHFTKMRDLLPDGADIITCYHSVEHYINPLDFFKTVKLSLRPGGIFLMSVPNGAYLPARLDYFGKFDWCLYPGHLQYFTPYSATVFLAKAGLRVIETFSYPWDGTSSQTDWLLKTLTGLPASQLPAPERFIDALADNALTRDLRVVAINDDGIVNASEKRYMGFERPWDVLRLPSPALEVPNIEEAAPNPALEVPSSEATPEVTGRSRPQPPGLPEPAPHDDFEVAGDFAVAGLLRTLWLIASPMHFLSKCKDIWLWFRMIRSESALRMWFAHFDASYYVRAHSDVRIAGVDPLLHFLLYGGRETRNPSPLFDTADYLSRHPDVRSSRVNPLLHFVVFGRAEKRAGGSQTLP